MVNECGRTIFNAEDEDEEDEGKHIERIPNGFSALEVVFGGIKEL